MANFDRLIVKLLVDFFLPKFTKFTNLIKKFQSLRCIENYKIISKIPVQVPLSVENVTI